MHSDSKSIESKQLATYRSAAAICARAMSSDGRCWAGDAVGSIFVAHVTEQEGASVLKVRWTVCSPGTGELRAPVRAILCRPECVLTSGAGPSIRLFDSSTWDKKGEFHCRGYGPVTSLAVWQPPGSTAAVGGSTSSSSSSSCLLLSGHEGGRVVMWQFQWQGSSSTLREIKPALGSATTDT